jgi:16S rRNA (adenine1518-N6/adenine1519-N6)-dimethyltransferase
MGVQARKRFGQHFLHDATVIERIVAALDPKPGDALIEIGPGRGALTRALVGRVTHLRAIEIDRDLVQWLREHFNAASLEVIEADVLTVDLAALRGAGPRLRLAGNLPYNISTPLLFHFLAQRVEIEDMHFMLQREVVERMAASPGSSAYGRLTVMLAPWVVVEPLFGVPATAFRPAPRVESAVVRLLPRREPLFDIGDPQRFDQVVRAAFSQRRKTLRNALRALVDADTMRQHDIDPTLRPERLAPAQFATLARLMRGPARPGVS